MTACEHRLLRLWRVTAQGRLYVCGGCGEAYLVTLAEAPAQDRRQKHLGPRTRKE